AMTTATRELDAPASPQLDPAKEQWAMFHDKRMVGDPAFSGPCAFAYVPDEVEPVKVNPGTYAVSPTLQTKPGVRKITVALWDFTPENNLKSPRSYLRDGGNVIRQDLQRVAAADWLADPLPEARIPTARREKLAGQVATRRQPTPYDQMTRKVVTPHVPWARPLAGGPVNALIVAPRWLQREVVELAQRLELRYRTVPFAESDLVFDSWSMYLYDSYDVYGYTRKNKTDILADFSQKLSEDADCIVVSGVHARAIPDHLRKRLLEKVRQGTGLMLFGCASDLLADCQQELETAAWTPEVVPMARLPVLRDMLRDEKPLATAYQLGKGRVLALHWPTARRHSRACFTPNLSHEDPSAMDYYDYYHSLVAAAMLWTSHRATPVQVRIDADAGSISLETEKAFPDVSIEVLSDDPTRSLRRRTVLRRSLPVGGTRITLPPLEPRTGPCLVSARVVKEKQCLGWDTGFRAQGEDLPRIESIDLEADVLNPGDAVEGRVRLSEVPDEASLELDLVDALSRQIAWRERVPQSREMAITLPLDQPVTVLHRLRTRLYQDGILLDQQVKDLTVPDSDVDGFHFLAWASAGNNAVSNYIMRELAGHGVDWIDSVGLTGADRARAALHGKNAARWNLKSIPYATRIHSERGEDRIRKPCLTDPDHMKPWGKGLAERAAGAAPYGPVAYTLGDENYLMRGGHDVCISPTCLAGFREELKSRHGSLNALNDAWQQEYSGWNEVVPETLEDVKETPRHWPRWADHRMYMDRVFTAAHAAGRDAIRRGHPEARVGFDGVFSLNSHHGYDFYELCQACDLNEVYASRFWQLEYIRCWHQPDSIRGAWYNRIGNRGETAANRIAWHLLLHQHNSSWYWTSYHCGPALLFPDLRPTPQLKWMQKTHAEIRGGVDKLLLNSKRLQDGVAIHYSQPSVHAATLQGHNLTSAQWGFALAVEDLGLQYDMVSNKQVEQGLLEDYRVLLLPSSTALSPAEAKKIRSFVRDGGLVVADRVPGVLDDHCQPLPAGQLDTVFGIRSGTKSATKSPEGGPIEIEQQGARGPLPLDSARCQFQIDGATAWGHAGEAPAVLVNEHEQGTALLLNARIDGYKSLHATEESLPVLRLLRKLLKDHNVYPPVTIQQEETKLGDCEVVLFQDGAMDYVAVLKEENRSSPKPSRATINLPEVAEVYDIRAGERLGRLKSVDVTLTPGDPTLLACLPHVVESVSLRVPERVTAGEVVPLELRLNVAGEQLAGKHCLRATWFAPDGTAAPHYTRKLLTDKPQVTTRIQLARNDQPGDWKVILTDVASGVSREKTVEVVAGDE
ncbi:MAG: beta-galactosidase trimerization domain-containing protein, partial [Planctomycetota bacterium]